MSDGQHRCPWPGCTERVPRRLWGCSPHWYRLPIDLRNELTAAWRSGSVARHMAALERVDDWIEANV